MVALVQKTYKHPQGERHSKGDNCNEIKVFRGGGATYSRSQVGSSTTRLLAAVLSAPRILAALATLAVAPVRAETVCYFDGSTYIDIGKGFPLGNSVSLSAWVRVDPQITTKKPQGAGSYGAGIVGQGYWGGATGLGIFANGGVQDTDTSNDAIAWQVRNSSGLLANDKYSDQTLFTAGEWHHYLLVRDKENGKARFYVDGALCGEEKDCSYSASITPTRNFAIGKNMTGTGGCFCGYIADVALWGVALSDADAARLPYCGVNGISTPPYAYFPLNEGEGNSVTGTDNGSPLTRSATGTLSWVVDPSFCRSRPDALCISSTLAGVGSPSPAYGVTNGLVAGASSIVACGSTPFLNATETVQYSCSGWKLYDKNGSVVSSGEGTSFTYTHPDPAEYRRLEWQWDYEWMWDTQGIRKKSTASLYVKDGLVACWDGIENAGAGSHDDSPSSWADLVGALGIAVPEWVTAESNGFCSVSSTDTRTYPAISSIPGLGDNVTIEVAAERVTWRTTDNQLALQPVISSPYGWFGYRYYDNSGVYHLLPRSSAGIAELYNYTYGGFDVSECHTFAARVTLPYDASNAMVVDGVAYAGFTRDGYNHTQALPSNWQFFNATRADVRIHAIRVYNRRLTDEEVAANHALDVKRFLEGNNIKVPEVGLVIFVR